MFFMLTARPSVPILWDTHMDFRVHLLSDCGAMAKDGRQHGKRVVKPANDNGLAGATLPEHFQEALVPLVRLLARQAAREWVEKVLNDNSQGMPEEPPKEPKEE